MKKMSKKKLLNLIQAILSVVLLVAMITIESVTLVSYSSSSTSTTTNTLSTSIMGYNLLFEGWWGFVVPVALLINILNCVVSVFGNSEDRDGKSHVFLAFFTLFFGWLNFTLGSAPKGYSTLTLNPVFRIFAITIIFLNVIIAIVKRSSLIVPKVEKGPTVIVKSDADELKKFKDLLDQGVITEEEFQEKKKKLLNL